MKQELQSIFEKCHAQDHIPALNLQFTNAGDSLYLFRGNRNPSTSHAVEVDDQWHIGSCGKAFTAWMISKLIQDKKLSYDSLVLKNISLSDLLCHTSGIPDEYPHPIWTDLIAQKQSDSSKRNGIFDYWSKREVAPEKNFVYSNWNYVLAATYACRVADLSYEELMKKYVFEPLNLTSVGFGAPGMQNSQAAIWGHFQKDEQLLPLEPSPFSDNPSFFAPAGGLHLSSKDWGKFVNEQMQSSQLWDRLPHAMINASTQYVVAGWIKETINNQVRYTHNGCNKLWAAIATFIPSKNIFWTLQTNCGSNQALKTLHQADLEIYRAL
jgi:CubicO group peptidase (beta-lactamase class C family)